MHSIIVFADGACTGNPGPGGWGAIIASPQGEVVELGGAERDTTNNKMELTAVGKALRFLADTKGPVEIYTDSTYVIHGITKWIWGWRKKGWKTSEGKDVANAEYWKSLSNLLSRRDSDSPVSWHYVRGHSGVPGNERVDEIAVAFAKGSRIQLYQGPLLKYDVAVFDLPEDTEPPEPRAREKPSAPFSYLSLVGNTVERHSTWKDCERRVKGVSGAKFKKCMNQEEEAGVLKSWGIKDLGNKK
ncbi:MAG: ribonuclease HI [Bdellovibrionota bacterium]